MARYKLMQDEDGNTAGVIVNDGTHPSLPQGASIPNDAANTDWVEYEQWVTDGGTADAADGIDWVERMRGVRDGLLAQTDWTQVSDVALTAQEVTDCATYRTGLRDMPQNNPTIADKAAYDALTWPTKPACISQ